MLGRKNIWRIKLLKIIAITGPESTGKSQLAQQLATHFNTHWVAEYAREYIDQLNRPYNQKDILNIAKTQYEQIQSAASQCKELLICDTHLLVTKIWSDHKYKECDPWILEHIEKQKIDLYLLCDIDLPWEADPQREHPHLRNHLFNLYKQNLESYNFNYRIVSGKGSDRINNAIKFVNTIK